MQTLFELYISDLVRSGRACLDLARESDRDGGEHQYHADHRESVAESQHQRLSLHGIAQRYDGLLMGRGGIGHAVTREEVGQLRNPAAYFLAAERDRLPDDVGVKLLSLGDQGGEQRGADGAAEVAQNVADTGWRGRVLRRYAPGGD